MQKILFNVDIEHLKHLFKKTKKQKYQVEYKQPRGMSMER